MLDAVFPIFRVGAEYADLAGTGFFVSAEGHYLTCAHTFEQMPGARYVAIPVGYAEVFLDNVWNQPAFDLAGGRMLLTPSSWFGLSITPPALGDPVSLLGFGGREVPVIKGTPVFDGLPDRITSELQGFEIVTIPAHGSIQTKRFPAVATTSQGIAVGFSGGPLVDERSKVVGVFSHTRSSGSDDNQTHLNLFVDTIKIRISPVALGL